MNIISQRASQLLIIFLRLSGFPDLFDKVFLNTFKFSLYDFSRSFIKRQTSGASSDNEWYNEWQRVVQRVTTSGSGTTNDNEWLFPLIFLFFQIREEPTTKHSKENSLNIEKDLWRRPIELRAETSP